MASYFSYFSFHFALHLFSFLFPLRSKQGENSFNIPFFIVKPVRGNKYTSPKTSVLFSLILPSFPELPNAKWKVWYKHQQVRLKILEFPKYVKQIDQFKWISEVQRTISYNIKEEWNPSPETSVCSHKRCLVRKPESCGICVLQLPTKYQCDTNVWDQEIENFKLKHREFISCNNTIWKLIVMGFSLLLPLLPPSNLHEVAFIRQLKVFSVGYII